MPDRRILSLWFPCLAAERLIRARNLAVQGPLAVVAPQSNTQVITSLNGAGLAAGLRVGQTLGEANALCQGLVTQSADPLAEAAFLARLRRWAGKFSPAVAEEPPDALAIDLTGCAHLFGGEAAVMAAVDSDCAGMGLTVTSGIADTKGAAWALARYAGQPVAVARSGDSIDQEARATRSRAAKRHWTRGGTAPQRVAVPDHLARIAPPGRTYSALSPLPVAALRIDPKITAQLARLGLRRIGDLLGQPREGLARRFGTGLVLRLDQAMGHVAEPISPAPPPDPFAVSLRLPEPIGLTDDLMAALDRLLPHLCARLEERGRGARSLRLEAHRIDQPPEVVTVGLAAPGHDITRMRPLLELKVADIDSGYGIDMLRLTAVVTEPLDKRGTDGMFHPGRPAAERPTLDDLVGRLGVRIGLEAITRRHPVDTHIPEKTSKTLAAAWSEPARDWPPPPAPRPLTLCRPEMVQAPERPEVPAEFRWRGRLWHLAEARGPERIAPEWWLDDPEWRSGLRDYWVVTTAEGARLWLFYAHGAALSPGWFCQGSFA
ncbi:Y-family DNA polymerase [Seohaeicola nanhaiensis]|uniref:Y-family DNA polymerase n=1 Tax=Seohaeicola nanhaiensis TaxID=1387282 RepID=A0ABV9KFP5_9RHOB